MLPLRRPISWVTTLSLVVGILVFSGRIAQATESISPLTSPAPQTFRLRLAEQVRDDDGPGTKDRDDPLLTRAAPVSTEPTPYWKTWWFWTATGLGVATLAVATAVLLAYQPHMHACPGYATLGCYGEGR